MQKKDKIIDNYTSGFIKGIRVGNISIKIYYYKEEQYLIIRRKYFLFICYSIKKVIVNDFYSAEDYLNNIEFDVHKIE